MKLPCLFQFRILKLAVEALFSKPYTTEFPAEPFKPIEEFRGRPRFSEEDCIGCGACAEVCPANCIDLIDNLKAEVPARKLIHHLDVCICCGQCERYCTSEKGIRMTNEWDFAGFRPEDFMEGVEKELLLCECCGCLLAPKDQIQWLVNRLGPLAFANPTLMLSSQKQLEVVDPGTVPADGLITRSSRLLIQCPKCRRKTAFEA